MTDIYQAPSANLSDNPTTFIGIGSVENGIAGNYDFKVGDLIHDAWNTMHGYKGTIWLGFLLYVIVVGAMVAFFEMLGTGSIGKKIIFQLIQTAVAAPFMAGLYMMGIKIAAKVPVTASEVFDYLNRFLNLAIAGILIYVMVIIGLVFLILPGIYLAVSYGMTMQLIAEKNMKPWEAMETSRKAIGHQWFKIFGLYLALFLIMIAAIIPLGFGLIWALPLSIVVFGTLYTKIFGYGDPSKTIEAAATV